MKYILSALLALNLCSCASIRQARTARKVAAAHAVLATYATDTKPEDQLSQLIAAHPSLEGSTVRVVTQHDTVRIAASSSTATLPAVSTRAGDKALIDSLLRSISGQMKAKDSAAFSSRLMLELAHRPRLSHDTVTQHIGPITVKLYTDPQGRAQAVVKKAVQNVAYEKVIHETGPVLVQQVARPWYETAWLWVRNALGLLIGVFALICGVWIFYAFRRAKQGII